MNVDDLVKQAKQYLENENSGKGKELDVENTPNVFGMASSDELEFSVGRLDILVASLWMLMKEKGFTDDELMNKITTIINERKGVVYQKDVLKCSKCGNNIQEVKKTPLTGRCYYCGAMYVLYPYNDKPMPEELVPIETKAEVPEVVEKKEESELPTTFEPYDVSKDLGFDDYE